MCMSIPPYATVVFLELETKVSLPNNYIVVLNCVLAVIHILHLVHTVSRGYRLAHKDDVQIW